MQPVDGTKHSCPSPGAGQDEPRSTEVQQAKRWSRPGVAAIEYCLLLSLIMVFLIIAVQSLGMTSKGIFQRMATIFASDGAGTGGDDQEAGGDDDGDDDRGGHAGDDDDDDERGRGQGRQGRGRGWGRGGRR